MPRLLILCEYPTLLGGERSMLATLPAVAAAGFELQVAAPPQGPLADALREHGIDHPAWQTHDDQGQRLSLDQLRADLAALLQRHRPQLVHANSLSTARIAGPVAAQSGVPSLGHLRDIVKLARQAIDDLNAHSRLAAVSSATRDFHVAHGLDAKKCTVVFNGVDLDEFCPRPPTYYLHRELGLPTTARLVATIGQLGLRKGVDIALDAALAIARAVPDVHWLFVGERTSHKEEAREFEASLRSMADEESLKGRVHFLGARTDVSRLLNECVLVVHAARQEPLGRVLLESAASGLAIVATDVGGTREIFPQDAEEAVLVPADDRAALAQAVLALLRDADRRHSLGAAARRRAESAFDIRMAAARLIDLYQSILS
jgi:glycosyltransferase involved in cell wall biosynthesis